MRRKVDVGVLYDVICVLLMGDARGDWVAVYPPVTGFVASLGDV